jgi:sec-independent protein translocase protein TatC
MSHRLRRVAHEERLSTVDHLAELRSRAIASLAVLAVAVAVCFWRNQDLLQLLRQPIGDRQLATFAVGEAFMVSLKVSIYAGILLALPVITYQVYAFVVPVLAEDQQRHVRPLLLLVPALFVTGVAFGWKLVLPPALGFLLSYNASVYATQLRAGDYIQFVTLTLAAMGLVFELPAVMLVLARVGVVTAAGMRRHWRVSVVGLVALAVALPGTDPVTMLVELAPLLVLYGFSYVLVSLVERRAEPGWAAR